MKYLGVYVDKYLTFADHFDYMKQKVSRIMRAIDRLMPNLRGPGEMKRRLYANVLMSILTYGAPVWSDAFTVKRQAPLRRLKRTIALRVVSAYRTVSFDAATLLAKMPPLFLIASIRKRVFLRLQDLRFSGE